MIPGSVNDAGWMGPILRTRREIKSAVARLADPLSRLEARFWWFCQPPPATDAPTVCDPSDLAAFHVGAIVSDLGWSQTLLGVARLACNMNGGGVPARRTIPSHFTTRIIHQHSESGAGHARSRLRVAGKVASDLTILRLPEERGGVFHRHLGPRNVESAAPVEPIMNNEDDARIVIDPKILVGKPVIRGTRIAVEFVIDLLAEGWSNRQILLNSPHLTESDIIACLRYVGSMMKQERIYPIPA